jgi:ketosteroid isomerase-like protein
MTEPDRTSENRRVVGEMWQCLYAKDWDEHTETWHFETGERVVNHFVTVHEVKDGRITLWRDYWDLNTLMSQAPQWWIERLAGFGDSDFS